jgi:hypothetical protein
MKSIALSLALVTVALTSHAQTPKTVINCWITYGQVSFGPLAKLLPDSIRDSILVDPHKKFGMKDPEALVLWFEQHGWKLAGVGSPSALGINANAYVLSKEIDLDEATRARLLQKLENKEY